MTLEDLKYSYIFYVLVKNDFVKNKTAIELGISVRSLTDQIRKMKEKGYVVNRSYAHHVQENSPKEYEVSHTIMPKNEDRLRYRDWLINADRLVQQIPRLPSL
jgi:predicted ABC-type ATPase